MGSTSERQSTVRTSSSSARRDVSATARCDAVTFVASGCISCGMLPSRESLSTGNILMSESAATAITLWLPSLRHWLTLSAISGARATATRRCDSQNSTSFIRPPWRSRQSLVSSCDSKSASSSDCGVATGSPPKPPVLWLLCRRRGRPRPRADVATPREPMAPREAARDAEPPAPPAAPPTAKDEGAKSLGRFSISERSFVAVFSGMVRMKRSSSMPMSARRYTTVLPARRASSRPSPVSFTPA
mmetsp:Transcript_10527/g.36728  ORF Transcript_10527/g.36728 Transcript_10527/m.36728 type:complete len:245 (+) Transcript_10527:417-1151(+)